MESEALKNIRTMRQVKKGLDAVRQKKIRTTNSLSKSKEEIGHLESIKHPQLRQVLTQEKRRFANRDASQKRSRRRVLKAREQLAAMINKNRALMKLRHQLQQARWKNPDPPSVTLDPPNKKFNEVEVNY